jgi:hypothetical protein
MFRLYVRLRQLTKETVQWQLRRDATSAFKSSIAAADLTVQDGQSKEEKAVKRKRGPPRKVENETTTATSKTPSKKVISSTSKKPKRTPRQSTIPTTLLAQNAEHHNLSTFLDNAQRTELNPNSTVYKGTRYEYMVASALEAYNFSLYRTGRANDLGIDLVGTFTLPIPKRIGRPKKRASSTKEMRVIVQCKAVNPLPSMVRELEGAYVGAPAGWRGEGVLALLVAGGPATKGIRAALQRSRWPMALMQVTTDGWMKQFLWNAAATAAGLEGLGVTVRYGSGKADSVEKGDEEKEKCERTIALTWMGKVVGMSK